MTTVQPSPCQAAGEVQLTTALITVVFPVLIENDPKLELEILVATLEATDLEAEVARQR